MIGNVYPPEDQSKGSLDGGRITEQKPIGFSGEGSAVTRVGPLSIGPGFVRPSKVISRLIPIRVLKS